ncbi:hypothetical protein C8Q78DRAFT_540750 [Trametes maxima]|nr:hypothetical protein C8Q78DRAFT_540750 [Trametes maxima]
MVEQRQLLERRGQRLQVWAWGFFAGAVACQGGHRGGRGRRRGLVRGRGLWAWAAGGRRWWLSFKRHCGPRADWQRRWGGAVWRGNPRYTYGCGHGRDGSRLDPGRALPHAPLRWHGPGGVSPNAAPPLMSFPSPVQSPPGASPHPPRLLAHPAPAQASRLAVSSSRILSRRPACSVNDILAHKILDRLSLSHSCAAGASAGRSGRAAMRAQASPPDPESGYAHCTITKW